MTDLDLLRRAVVENPDDDTPRLMYADELDDRATTDAERARAEFIRLDIALDRLEDLPMSQYELRFNPHDAERCRKLFREFRTVWLPTCYQCKGDGYLNADRMNGNETKCPACKGSGRYGRMNRGFPVCEVAFGEMGGTPALSLPSGGVWQFFHKWLAWAISAVRECGASFKVTGREPHPYRYVAKDSYFWKHENKSDGPEDLTTLPGQIWTSDLISKPTASDNRKAVDFQTIELAHAALDAALTRIVVKKAYQQSQTASETHEGGDVE